MEEPEFKKTKKTGTIPVAQVVSDKNNRDSPAIVVHSYDKQNIPREDRPDKVLRMECENKKLSKVGVRKVLIARLEAFDQGRPVITQEHMDVCWSHGVTNFVDVKALSFFIEPQRAPVYGRGDMQLLALPHDIIRERLLPWLDDSSLFSLLLTCKYIHADVLPFIRRRVAQVFRDDDRATPLALSCLQKIQNMGAPRLGELFKINFVFNTGISALRNVFDKYGSLEGFYAAREKKKERLLLREEERVLVRANAAERYAELVQESERIHFPPFWAGVDIETGTFVLTPLGQIFYDFNRFVIFERARKFVFLQGYASAKTVFAKNQIPEGYMDLVDCIRRTADLKTYNPGISVYLRSFFIPQLKYNANMGKVKLFGRCAVSPAKIETLVTWIASHQHALAEKGTILILLTSTMIPVVCPYDSKDTWNDVFMLFPEKTRNWYFPMYSNQNFPKTDWNELRTHLFAANADVRNTRLKFPAGGKDKLFILCIDDMATEKKIQPNFIIY